MNEIYLGFAWMIPAVGLISCAVWASSLSSREGRLKATLQAWEAGNLRKQPRPRRKKAPKAAE